MATRATLILVLLFLTGCLQDGKEDRGEAPPLGPVDSCPSAHTTDAAPDDPAPVPVPVREGFETVPSLVVVNGLPPGWSATDGSWQVREDVQAAEGSNVLHGQGDDDPGFSAALAGPAGSLSDLDASVAFRMECVEHPHGVGMVLHVAGPDDYQIVRYSATESSWDLFTVNGGERVKHDEARQEDVDHEVGEWTTLRVVSSAGTVKAYADGRLVVDYALAPEDAAAGQVGLFLRGSSSATFDDVRIDGLPASLPVALTPR